MADRPIIFSAPMVQALLAGRKSQTRRVLKPQPEAGVKFSGVERDGSWLFTKGCFYGTLKPLYAPGDRLWVREAFATDGPIVRYYATDHVHELRKKRPSIHMPRWASRLTLTVTDVRVQRLQDISESDAVAEGVIHDGFGGWRGHEGTIGYPTAIWAYHHLWNSLHGPGAWDANPWVVALTFTVQRGNIDQIGDANG